MAPRIPLAQYEARRIAFIKPSALGDIAHALPVLEAVRIRYPSAQITWVVNKSYQSLIENHPALSDVLPFDRSAMRKGTTSALRYALKFTGELRKRRFDLALDLQGLLRSGLMARFTNAARRVGLANAREGSRYLYTDVIPSPGLLQQHAVDRNWLFAEALGVGHLPKKFRLPIRESVRQTVQKQFVNYARPFLAIAPGARWLTKRWPITHFAASANRMQNQFGGTVFILGGSEDSELSAALQQQVRGPIVNCVGRTDLPHLTATLEQMDALLANDSGPLHLATALGRPVAAPYTCTRPDLHGPYGQLEAGIATKVYCRGSYIRSCDRMICMADLQPEHLWPVLAKALNRWQSTSRSA